MSGHRLSRAGKARRWLQRWPPTPAACPRPACQGRHSTSTSYSIFSLWRWIALVSTLSPAHAVNVTTARGEVALEILEYVVDLFPLPRAACAVR